MNGIDLSGLGMSFLSCISRLNEGSDLLYYTNATLQIFHIHTNVF